MDLPDDQTPPNSASSPRSRWLRWSPRTIRYTLYFLIIAGIASWRFYPRKWTPSVVIETAHFVISSTASREDTEAMGSAAEALYRAYEQRFQSLPSFRREHPKLKLRLYSSREEFRWIHPGLDWEEAFYQEPYCNAYVATGHANSHHWMLHEVVHQLNHEVAQLELEQWLDEGLAEYLSTSRIIDGELQPGTIDPLTYPVWWKAMIATSRSLPENLENGSVIPLRAIITDSGGPSMDANVNLYYLHWWTLAHFLFESEKHRPAMLALLSDGGDLAAVEQRINPIETLQADWHAHVHRIKDTLTRFSPEFQRTGRLEP